MPSLVLSGQSESSSLPDYHDQLHSLFELTRNLPENLTTEHRYHIMKLFQRFPSMPFTYTFDNGERLDCFFLIMSDTSLINAALVKWLERCIDVWKEAGQFPFAPRPQTPNGNTGQTLYDPCISQIPHLLLSLVHSIDVDPETIGQVIRLLIVAGVDISGLGILSSLLSRYLSHPREITCIVIDIIKDLQKNGYDDILFEFINGVNSNSTGDYPLQSLILHNSPQLLYNDPNFIPLLHGLLDSELLDLSMVCRQGYTFFHYFFLTVPTFTEIHHDIIVILLEKGNKLYVRPQSELHLLNGSNMQYNTQSGKRTTQQHRDNDDDNSNDVRIITEEVIPTSPRPQSSGLTRDVSSFNQQQQQYNGTNSSSSNSGCSTPQIRLQTHDEHTTTSTPTINKSPVTTNIYDTNTSAVTPEYDNDDPLITSGDDAILAEITHQQPHQQQQQQQQQHDNDNNNNKHMNTNDPLTLQRLNHPFCHALNTSSHLYQQTPLMTLFDRVASTHILSHLKLLPTHDSTNNPASSSNNTSADGTSTNGNSTNGSSTNGNSTNEMSREHSRDISLPYSYGAHSHYNTNSSSNGNPQGPNFPHNPLFITQILHKLIRLIIPYVDFNCIDIFNNTILHYIPLIPFSSTPSGVSGGSNYTNTNSETLFDSKLLHDILLYGRYILNVQNNIGNTFIMQRVLSYSSLAHDCKSIQLHQQCMQYHYDMCKYIYDNLLSTRASSSSSSHNHVSSPTGSRRHGGSTGTAPGIIPGSNNIILSSPTASSGTGGTATGVSSSTSTKTVTTSATGGNGTTGRSSTRINRRQSLLQPQSLSVQTSTSGNMNNNTPPAIIEHNQLPTPPIVIIPLVNPVYSIWYLQQQYVDQIQTPIVVDKDLHDHISTILTTVSNIKPTPPSQPSIPPSLTPGLSSKSKNPLYLSFRDSNSRIYHRDLSQNDLLSSHNMSLSRTPSKRLSSRPTIGLTLTRAPSLQSPPTISNQNSNWSSSSSSHHTQSSFVLNPGITLDNIPEPESSSSFDNTANTNNINELTLSPRPGSALVVGSPDTAIPAPFPSPRRSFNESVLEHPSSPTGPTGTSTNNTHSNISTTHTNNNSSTTNTVSSNGSSSTSATASAQNGGGAHNNNNTNTSSNHIAIDFSISNANGHNILHILPYLSYGKDLIPYAELILKYTSKSSMYPSAILNTIDYTGTTPLSIISGPLLADKPSLQASWNKLYTKYDKMEPQSKDGCIIM